MPVETPPQSGAEAKAWTQVVKRRSKPAINQTVTAEKQAQDPPKTKAKNNKSPAVLVKRAEGRTFADTVKDIRRISDITHAN